LKRGLRLGRIGGSSHISGFELVYLDFGTVLTVLD
jgi:hypothetical protein